MTLYGVVIASIAFAGQSQISGGGAQRSSVFLFPSTLPSPAFSFSPTAWGFLSPAKSWYMFSHLLGPHLGWRSVFDALARVKREEWKTWMFPFVLQLLLLRCLPTIMTREGFISSFPQRVTTCMRFPRLYCKISTPPRFEPTT